MDFIDGIENKVKTDDDYKPQDYAFSDGEGVEEVDLAEAEESSEQEGFSDIISSDEEVGQEEFEEDI